MAFHENPLLWPCQGVQVDLPGLSAEVHLWTGIAFIDAPQREHSQRQQQGHSKQGFLILGAGL